MTRINVVPVEVLSNEHCMAEYKEITRPFNKAIKRMVSGKGMPKNIPTKYRLGSGHETFWFNKLGTILERYEGLCEELLKRGYNIDLGLFENIRTAMYEGMEKYPELFNTYTPDHDDLYLNMARLAKRSNMERSLYELEVGY